jgi:hypothetical protein
MFYRINIIVLSHTDSSTEYFTKICRLDPPSSTFRALREFLNDPTHVDEAYLSAMAEHVVGEFGNYVRSVDRLSEIGAALVRYRDKRQFYLDLVISHDGYDVTLYPEDGD